MPEELLKDQSNLDSRGRKKHSFIVGNTFRRKAQRKKDYFSNRNKVFEFRRETTVSIGSVFDVRFVYGFFSRQCKQVRYGLTVRIAGFHPAGPGSTPGSGTTFFFLFFSPEVFARVRPDPAGHLHRDSGAGAVHRGLVRGAEGLVCNGNRNAKYSTELFKCFIVTENMSFRNNGVSKVCFALNCFQIQGTCTLPTSVLAT